MATQFVVLRTLLPPVLAEDGVAVQKSALGMQPASAHRSTPPGVHGHSRAFPLAANHGVPLAISGWVTWMMADRYSSSAHAQREAERKKEARARNDALVEAERQRNRP